MTLSTFRRWVLVPMAALLLIVTAVAFAPYYKASRDMDAFCGSLAVGTAFADVQSRGAGAGYEVSDLAGDRALIRDPRSFGRLQCEVRFDARGLASADSSGG
jgi:hypothetical protein